MKPYDLLVAGEINPDLILSGDVEPVFGQVEKLVESAALTLGSSSVIFACGAARLGLKVAFIGKCGDDVFGTFMRDAMQERGVNVANVIVVPSGVTGLSVILNRGIDRAILTHPGLIPALAAEDIPDSLLRQARHLHVASYFLQDALRPGLPSLFARARALGLTTSLDTNYDPTEVWHGVWDLLPLTNVFLPNEAEACALTGEADVEAAAEKLSAHVETLAIKLGAQGALAISPLPSGAVTATDAGNMTVSARAQGALAISPLPLGAVTATDAGNMTVSARAQGALAISPLPSGEGPGVRVRVPTIPVQVVDTVGAGDSFDAGFLYGYLNGWPLERSLRLAVVCGALSTQAAGGVAGQPTLDQALACLKAST